MEEAVAVDDGEYPAVEELGVVAAGGIGGDSMGCGCEKEAEGEGGED